MTDDVYEAKVALENNFQWHFKRLMSEYLRDWEKSKDRDQADAKYLLLLIKLCRRHYMKIASVFAIEGMNVVAPAQAGLMNMAKHVVGTTAAVMAESENEFRKDKTASKAKASKMAIKMGHRSLKSRAVVIANMATQAYVERIREDSVKHKMAGEPYLKGWTSWMDGKERMSHHSAHLRYHAFENAIAADQTFTLGWGVRLRFPGDMSLGAPLKEIINCRCWLRHYDLDGNVINDGPRLTSRQRRWAQHGAGTTILGTPTTSTTLTQGIRNRVILSDGKIATVIREGDQIRVIRNRKTITTAHIRGVKGHRDVWDITNYADSLGADALIQRSVAELNRMESR